MPADLTVSQLVATCKALEEHFLTKLGYDSVSSVSVTVRPSGTIQFSIRPEDTFQNDVDYDSRINSHQYQYFYWPDLWEEVGRLMGRERRELELLAQRMAALGSNLDQIRSAQVQAFVKELQPKMDELRRQIAPAAEMISSDD